MTVACPKCRTRLRVPDEKVSLDGTRFRCPKCSTVLLVRKRVKRAEEIQKNLVLVCHSDEEVRETAGSILTENGFRVIYASDGVDAMVKAMKELPEIVVIDVALPKIYGFEVCKRIKERKETAGIKVLLIASIYDRSRYRRPPQSLYGADEYVEEPALKEELLEKIRIMREGKTEKEPSIPDLPPLEKTETAAPPTVEAPSRQEYAEVPEEKTTEEVDKEIERARRLARTVVSDIYLYNPQKVLDSIKDGNFHETFKNQLSEGLKLYNLRIPPEVRQKGDFFNEEIEKFIQNKREEQGI